MIEIENVAEESRETAVNINDALFCVLDIETGPLPDDLLLNLCPAFNPPPPPGDFDESAVKTGNLGTEKAQAKIAEKRAEHRLAVEGYDAWLKKVQSEHFAKFKDRAALDATTGRVVAIGLRYDDGSITIVNCDDDEAEGLQNWWGWLSARLVEQCPIVGFNIHAFDLPFLVRRSWILGVPVPLNVRQGRYWNPLFIDLMRVWMLDGRDMVSLDTLAKAFGLSGKLRKVDGQEVSGAAFHQLWRSNPAVAAEYLKRDLELPAQLAVKMGVV